MKYNNDFENRNQISYDFFKKIEYDKTLRKTYQLIVEQAYKCIQQILQNTLFNEKITSLSNDFVYIVANYNERILNEFNTNKIVLPNYSINMFFALMLFPTNELYLKNKDNKEKIVGINSDILKAREDLIVLEKKLFNESITDMRNEKIKNIDNQECINEIDDFEFNLIKSLITKKVWTEKFIDFENQCLHGTKQIVKNYQSDVPSEYKHDLALGLTYYHENKIYKNDKYKANNIYDANIFPVVKALEKK